VSSRLWSESLSVIVLLPTVQNEKEVSVNRQLSACHESAVIFCFDSVKTRLWECVPSHEFIFDDLAAIIIIMRVSDHPHFATCSPRSRIRKHEGLLLASSNIEPCARCVGFSTQEVEDIAVLETAPPPRHTEPIVSVMNWLAGCWNNVPNDGVHGN
jgi:hypothetical protein